MTHLFLCNFTGSLQLQFFFLKNFKRFLKGREVKGKVQIHFSVRVEG
jgi:hypothetical protein